MTPGTSHRRFSGIRSKLLLIVALPVVALAGFAGWIGWERGQQLALAHAIRDEVVIAQSAGRLVHELQRERGASAGFVASKGGADLRQALAALRVQTDRALGAFRELTARQGLDDAALAQALAASETALTQLPAMRREIDEFSKPVPAVVAYYANLIASLLATSNAIIGNADATGYFSRLLAYRALVQAKEAAGLERANFNALIASGTFNADLYRTGLGLSIRQEQELSEFRTFANADARSMLEHDFKPDVTAPVERLRGLLKEAATTGRLDGLSAKDWWDASTARIDALHEAELTISAGMVDYANGRASADALGFVILVAGIATIAVLVAVVVSTTSARLVGPISWLTAQLRNLAENGTAHGTSSVAERDLARTDETGDLARAVVAFQEAASRHAAIEREAKRKEADAAAERQRAEAAAVAHERHMVVQSIGAALASVAAKRLDLRLAADLPNAYVELVSDFNKTLSILDETLSTILGGIDDFGATSRELAQAAGTLATKSEQQAAAVEETTAALESLVAASTRSAEETHRARQMAADVAASVRQGVDTVRLSVDAMHQIENSSREIGSIVGLIDEIAFQTNLLALNAGVEAARAGDAGRGFAVVATEIRSLAGRCSSAALKIKELIASSNSRVEHGVGYVQNTGERLQAVAAQVEAILAIITSIAQEISRHSDEFNAISSTVKMIDRNTQQNASTAEQTSASAALQVEICGQLETLVREFTVTAGAGAKRQRRAA